MWLLIVTSLVLGYTTPIAEFPTQEDCDEAIVRVMTVFEEDEPGSTDDFLLACVPPKEDVKPQVDPSLYRSSS